MEVETPDKENGKQEEQEEFRISTRRRAESKRPII